MQVYEGGNYITMTRYMMQVYEGGASTCNYGSLHRCNCPSAELLMTNRTIQLHNLDACGRVGRGLAAKAAP
jgi:hypothetical protein